MSSNEAYVGLADGNVTRCRAITRVRADKRWRADLVANISGTPAQPSLVADDSLLEAHPDPHVFLDAKELELLELEGGIVDAVS